MENIAYNEDCIIGMKKYKDNFFDLAIVDPPYGLGNKLVDGGAYSGGKIHPCQKPIKLYEWILKNYAKKSDLILDTHLGSGSSRIAAYKGGFNFMGFEIDKEYFLSQENRFNVFKKQTIIEF